MKINDGGFYFEKSLTAIVQNIIDNAPKTPNAKEHLIFTDRELDIVRLTLKEYSGIQIANKLCISPKTVEKHKRNLMEKIGAKNFIGVITYALIHDFLSLK